MRHGESLGRSQLRSIGRSISTVETLVFPEQTRDYQVEPIEFKKLTTLIGSGDSLRLVTNPVSLQHVDIQWFCEDQSYLSVDLSSIALKSLVVRFEEFIRDIDQKVVETCSIFKSSAELWVVVKSVPGSNEFADWVG